MIVDAANALVLRRAQERRRISIGSQSLVVCFEPAGIAAAAHAMASELTPRLMEGRARVRCDGGCDWLGRKPGAIYCLDITSQCGIVFRPQTVVFRAHRRLQSQTSAALQPSVYANAQFKLIAMPSAARATPPRLPRGGAVAGPRESAAPDAGTEGGDRSGDSAGAQSRRRSAVACRADNGGGDHKSRARP